MHRQKANQVSTIMPVEAAMTNGRNASMAEAVDGFIASVQDRTECIHRSFERAWTTDGTTVEYEQQIRRLKQAIVRMTMAESGSREYEHFLAQQ